MSRIPDGIRLRKLYALLQFNPDLKPAFRGMLQQIKLALSGKPPTLHNYNFNRYEDGRIVVRSVAGECSIVVHLTAKGIQVGGMVGGKPVGTFPRTQYRPGLVENKQ